MSPDPKVELWILCFFLVEYVQVPSANYQAEKRCDGRSSKELGIFSRRKPVREETLTLPSLYPGLEIFNRREPKGEETLASPRTCSGLCQAVHSSTIREEIETPERYSHGRFDPASLLPSLEPPLRKIGEEHAKRDFRKQPPPVRNDIKLQGPPFQVKKSHSLNPGSF